MKVKLDDLIKLHNLPKLVFDVGGYNGDYTEKIFLKFGCRVVIFEPIEEYFNICKKRFLDNENITVVHAAIGKENKKVILRKDGNTSSEFYGSFEKLEMEICDMSKLSDFVSILGLPNIIKLNCQGGEYVILEDLKQNSLLSEIPELLIQFHRIRGFSRRDWIKELSKSHDLLYSFKWCLFRKKI